METNIYQAIILGIVQGLTEFLPISSSGHLVLVPYVFGWEDPGLAFDVALHFGTLLAVMAFFWKDLIIIISNFRLKTSDFPKLGQDNLKDLDKHSDSFSENNRYPSNMLWLLAIATIPGALAGYLLNDYAETVFRNPLLIAMALALFGFFLFFADKKSQKSRQMADVKMTDAVMIGLSQALAIVPGVSRSGITITAGLMKDLDRKTVARFSFLLSIPIILGASLAKVGDIANTSFGVVEIVGIISAALSGYFAIAWLIKFVEKASYQVFFWYRLVLAGVIVAIWAMM